MQTTSLLFLKCLAIGFSIAMILGPIGILCIQQSLSNGFGAGMAVGLGASLADGIYAAVAGLGLCAISNFLINQQCWLALFGGLFLIYLGIMTLFKKPVDASSAVIKAHKFNLFGTTLFLTLTNPVTIISFSALLASINIINPGMGTVAYAFFLFASFFIGSMIWWIILSGSLSMFRHKINLKILNTLNKVAGFVLIGFGAVALIKAAVDLL